MQNVSKRIHSDEGLTLETSASESLYGGQFTLSTQLIKSNQNVGAENLYFHLASRQLHIILIEVSYKRHLNRDYLTITAKEIVISENMQTCDRRTKCITQSNHETHQLQRWFHKLLKAEFFHLPQAAQLHQPS